MAKMGAVADFIDIWLNVRFWNSKLNSYSHMEYAAFTVISRIRGKTLEGLRNELRQRLKEEFEEINFGAEVRLNKSFSKVIHRQLARFTDWLDQQAGEPGRYEDYIVRSGKNAYEIEHILANNFEMFSEEFRDEAAFEEARNSIGGLLLLPKKVNASLGDKPYEEKLQKYLQQNKLAQSLHPDFYGNNPGVLRAIRAHNLPFKSHETFNGDDIRQRSALYRALADLIWSPDRLLNKA
ncbi:MAG: HNH endonuclease [Rhodobacteraceae bacterium]|nr:HNH endonuclease [Paracoccaceae bacterium]